TLKIDLGGNTFKTYNWSGYPAIELENMNLTFHDFKKEGQKAGTLFTHYYLDYPTQLGMTLAHFPNYTLGISYYDPNTTHYSDYFRFDKYKKLPNTKEPITFQEPINATWSPLKYYRNDQQIGFLGSNGGDLKAGFVGDNNTVRFGRQWSQEFETSFSCTDFRKTTNNTGFISWENADFNKNVNVFGNFWVKGTKNCLQGTKDYGERLINAYETLGYYFGDLGRGFVGEDGIAYIEIEDMVTQIMNTYIPYHVTYTEIVPEMMTDEEIRQRSPLRLVKTTPTYFILKGEPGAEFTWEIKAKR
ncbi:hypothetical protein AB2T14_003762, partial [Clostridium botulinum]